MQNFQVYRTSAGAGKTYTIVKEFIKLSINSPKSAANIAAITFTNKAANEMKERIIEYLVGISNNNPKPDMVELCNSIAKETKLEPSFIINNCKKTLSFLLHNYSKFAISTIDSFVHEILRVFSRDLKLPDNFNVEIDSEALIENIVNQVFANIKINETENESKLVNKYLLDLTLDNFLENEKWDITFILQKTAKILFNEDSIESVKNLSEIDIQELSNFSNSISLELKKYQEEIRDIANSAHQYILNAGLNETSFFQGARGIGGFFINLKNYKFSDEISINSYHSKAIYEQTWVTKGKNDIPENVKQYLISQFNKIITNPLYKKNLLLLKIKNNISTLALISYMQRIFNLYKLQNDLVHISEFNKTVSEVVKNESAPFIYERIGQQFKHFLLDEFQDTSILQWQNLFPLVENTLANANKILIVGDVKQSIYKFRNSELNLLLSLPNIYPKPEINSYHWEIENLIKYNFLDFAELESFNNTNYRSDEQIVDFNNNHFKWISEIFGQENNQNNLINKAYQDCTQNIKATAKNEGFVCVKLLNDNNYLENQLNSIIEICESHRPNFKDIAILVRNNEKAKQIASCLMQKENPIPVISSESLSIDFSDKVKFIVNLISLLENNQNQAAIIASYTYLFKNNLLKTLSDFSFDYWLLTDNKTPLHKKFINLLKENNFEFNTVQLLSLNIYELSSKIISNFNFDKETDNYILFFQNAIFDYYRKNNTGLRQFLEWWELKGKKLSVIMPEGANAVKILSVHKSKGLQFPIVIYPFADYSLKKVKDDLWIDVEFLPDEIKEIKNFPKKLKKINLPTSISSKIDESSVLANVINQEKLKFEIDLVNIHYVAMTRAKNKLYVISKKNKKEEISYSTVSDLLNNYLSFLNTKKQINKIENENSDSYIFGHEKIDNEIKEKKLNQEILNHYIVRKSKAGKIAINNIQSKYNMHYSSDFGNVFHDFISIFDSNKNLEEQILKFSKSRKIENEYSLKIFNMTKMLMSDSVAGKFFKNNLKVLNEATIIYGTENYRPDKIVFENNKVYVIDFKTGIKQNKHKAQIANYCSLLQQMKYSDVEAYLIYINDESLEVEAL